MKFILKLLIFNLAFVTSIKCYSQVTLEANGPGNTYELINSILAPTGGDVVENPECIHPEFGRHIAEVWDADLNKFVFEFYIHVTPDNDRCINFDRQRVEIKTYDQSPAKLKGTSGETVVYKWRFKVPTGFQPSSNFTHIHQVKAVGGDESDPLFVLTARKGSPNKLELNYYEKSDLSSVKFTSEYLSLFENTWAEATERIKIDSINGTYSITIKKVSDGTTLLEYSNKKLSTIRSDNSFIRPKWGIYRSLLNSQDLRDESLRFASISIYEEPFSKLESVYETPKLKVVPNQISRTALIEFSINKGDKFQLDICGLNGQILKKLNTISPSEQGEYSNSYDLSDLKSGLYFVRLISTENQSVAKLLIL
jgi:hypothetical protein